MTGADADRGDAVPLERLVVLDRLEVGPARIRRNRISVPYGIVRGDRRDELELGFRWEENVLEPEDPSSVNLAAMIGAQVALNYGLFAKEIRFRGPLDAADRGFLADMAENTAREIFVNKLLGKNPFLVDPATRLAPERRERFLQAELTFEDPVEGIVPARPWRRGDGGHAVLSSGGKDSLVTYGVLRELGLDPHPIFGNESGRHWYTALGAYRAFRETEPRTARVWTNSDRVFSGMLRHLPFVRPDFARLRTDDYPIRLWTVAVFLFGTLPLVRARGLDRVLVGDEHDTSVRARRRGIPHFAGLYDQSRWFDQALTRYYRRKGWGVRQFSVLRPLSELLVQKTLLERYPDLFALQMSCHATHLDGERPRPCGRCEKCRRIVSMVVALGGDPLRCGYTQEQVDTVLASFSAADLHQERGGAEHVEHLLAERGRIRRTEATRPHPEVTAVRLDPDRSPLSDLPTELRRPLLGIYGEHATGMLRREGKVWVDVGPGDPPELLHPDPFERRDRRARARQTDPVAPSGPPATAEPRSHVLGDLTWPAAKRRLREVDLALLPVGALEQHGPHSPLDTDAFDAWHLAERVAAACSEPKPLVLPLLPYGVSYHHEDFPGTIGIDNDSLARMVRDIGMSCARNGFTKLVIVNGHGGNGPALHYAAQLINRDAHIFVCIDSGETSDSDIEGLVETPGDVHAGEIETSTTLATRPGLVDMTKARRSVPRFSSQYLEFSGNRSVDWYARTKKISPQGVLGDPTKASAEKGRAIWEVMIRNLVELVEHLKKLTLDEIWERRY